MLEGEKNGLRSVVGHTVESTVGTATTLHRRVERGEALYIQVVLSRTREAGPCVCGNGLHVSFKLYSGAAR